MCLSRTVTNSLGSSVSAMFSSTALESCKWKQTYFGIMQRLPATRAKARQRAVCFERPDRNFADEFLGATRDPR